MTPLGSGRPPPLGRVPTRIEVSRWAFARWRFTSRQGPHTARPAAGGRAPHWWQSPESRRSRRTWRVRWALVLMVAPGTICVRSRETVKISPQHTTSQKKSPGFVRGSGRHGLCSARHDKSVMHAWWCGECRWKERAASRTSLGAVFHFGAKDSLWACSPCYGESMVVCAVTPGAPTGRTCSAVAVHAITAAVDPVPPSPAPRQLRETAGRVRYGGARGQLTVRAGRGFHTHAVAAVCRELAVRFSITIRQHKSLRNLIEAIPEEDWRPIPYWMGGAAAVAEPTWTPFQGPPVRLIVRRVKPTPGSQLALFATHSYHGFIAGRDSGSSPWPDGSPARRAGSLCICHSAGLGKPSSAAPWHGCERFHSQPDGTSVPEPPTRQPKVPANSRQSGPRAPLAASSPRHLTLANVPRRAQGLPAAAEDRHRPHLPEIVPGPSPPLAPHRPFPCCNLIPSVDSG